MFDRHIYLAALALLVACASDPAAPDSSVTVVEVTPAAGTSGVGLTPAVTVTFSHAMMAGMEMNVMLHEGPVIGAAVPGSLSWSADRKTLTFNPTTALKPRTTYVLHLAPTLLGAEGQRLNHGGCSAIGGQNATSGMMGGMMGGGGMGTGMMGPGWQVVDGSHGMAFSFTTG